MPAEQLTGAIVTNYTIPAAAQITQNISATPMPTPIMVVQNATQSVVGTVANQPPATSLNPFFDIAPLHGVQFLWLNTIPLWAVIGAIVFFYW